MAREALRSVAVEPAPGVEGARIGELVEAVIAPRADAWRAVADRMLLDGCRAVEFLDTYIPAAAARLGTDWVEDRAGFAQVTLGCARLDALLIWADTMLDEFDEAPAAPQGRVCLIVPAGAQHRLGRHVFAAQLLRRGIAARTLHEGDSVDDADVVMISASGAETTELLRATVAQARTMGPDPVVILGGGAVRIARPRCDAAGADIVSDDIDLAVAHCRMPAPVARIGR